MGSKKHTQENSGRLRVLREFWNKLRNIRGRKTGDGGKQAAIKKKKTYGALLKGRRTKQNQCVRVVSLNIS